ncbi:helix-turn-helix domain-containing protein [Pontibacter chitinilyticus]|uniref:helix-turn-helix domain-containing protein n=1 Tax=Pontibacter chitinilyticus TaxID=2674989 RepID=UPI00321B09CA
MDKGFLRFDLYAALLLIGVAQGFFLSLLLLARRPHRQPFHHLLLAALCFTFACVVLEIFLCYSGLMFRTLALVDFSEALNFAIGPLTFLLVRSLCGKNWKPKLWLHFIPLGLYAIYHLQFMLQPEAVKYNAYLNAYFPDAAQLAVAYPFPPDLLHLAEHVNFLTIVHISIYILATYTIVLQQRNAQQVNNYFYSWAKLLLYFYACSLALLLFIKLYYKSDLGDHFMAMFLTMQLFFISYKVLTASAFFQPVVPAKYEKSALNAEAKQDLLRKLKMAENAKFYAQPSASLPSLAKQLHTSPHYLSQSLNECLGKSFFEYLAELRIQEARAILADPAQQHLKIEEVAEQTGYLSKSAFSAAFKKQTGQTPGEFRKNNSQMRASL